MKKSIVRHALFVSILVLLLLLEAGLVREVYWAGFGGYGP